MLFTSNIYGLRIAGGTIRYVGVTKRPLHRRLAGHLSKARKGERTHKAKWIRAELARENTIEIVLLRCVPLCSWQFWEQHFIAAYSNLTNGNAGGTGQRDPTETTRNRLRESHIGKQWSEDQHRNWRTSVRAHPEKMRREWPEEHRRKMSEARMGKGVGKCGTYERTDEYRQRSSAAKKGCRGPNLGRTFSDEWRANLAAAQLGKKRPPWTPERREKFAATWAAKKLRGN
jgi:hypothetical protein